MEDNQFGCLGIASLMSHIRLDHKLLGQKEAFPIDGLFHVKVELDIQQLKISCADCASPN